MAISTVVIFWTAVEVFARNGLLSEFWVEPLAHIPEMITILASFLLLAAFLIIRNRRRKMESTSEYIKETKNDDI